MLGLFKRTKIESWEIELLYNVIRKLPKEYNSLINQIEDNLFRNILLNTSDIPGYVSFGFNSIVYKKYYKKNERSYKITGIKVYDIKKQVFLVYTIYISSGVINGYSLSKVKKPDIDVNKIDMSDFKKEFIDEHDYNCIANILEEEEKKLLNPSEVYRVNINSKEFFHIKDLEDGDFIGIDEKKNIYKITHDPMEVIILNKKIIDILSE